MRVLFLLTFFLSNFSFAYNLAFDENLLSIKKVRKISSNFCKPCRSGVEEVSLLIAPSYDLKDVGEVNVDFVWYRPPSNIKKYGTYFVDRNEGVRDVFFQIASECKRIKYLAIASHGDLGSISLTHFDNIDVTNVDEVFADLDCVMAKNATIDFQGCNVGRGCRGEDFMMKLAYLLLNKGGEIKANTNYSVPLIPHVLPHMSINFDKQHLYVNENFDKFYWDNKPKSVAYCSNEIDKALDKINEISNKKNCKFSEGKKKNIQNIVNMLTNAKNENNFLGETRYGFREENFKAGRDFFAAFFYFNDFITHSNVCSKK